MYTKFRDLIDVEDFLTDFENNTFKNLIEIFNVLDHNKKKGRRKK